MKWIIMPSLIAGGISGFINYSSNLLCEPWGCGENVGEKCPGADGWNGHCTWYTCFSGYTCGGGGVEFKCLRFGGNVIDP